LKKISPNSPCPCGSRAKYKKCCQKYHKGAFAENALILMKSRYSAYATANIDYIIKTTARDNPQYNPNLKEWRESISQFCNSTTFEGLEIVEFIDGEKEAVVEFIAKLSGGVMRERSRFIKDERWLYLDGKWEDE